MPNPNVAQGTVNRALSSVIWTSFPALNVTAPYTAPEGLRMALEGVSTLLIPTMTGLVPSPEPYMPFSLTIHLLMSQPLSDAYKTQMETNATLGTGVARPVTTTLSPYQLNSAAIESINELDWSGRSASYVIRVRGYYLTNAAMWG